jgi:hypothetical protein
VKAAAAAVAPQQAPAAPVVEVAAPAPVVAAPAPTAEMPAGKKKPKTELDNGDPWNK